MSEPDLGGSFDEGQDQPYFPMDPNPNYLQAAGTAMTGAGFLALANDPSTGDTVEGAMALLDQAAELATTALAALGLDLYTWGLILVGLGTLFNIVSLWLRPREHFLSKAEQIRRRRQKEAVRPAVVSTL
jgi:hypothetical protein